MERRYKKIIILSLFLAVLFSGCCNRYLIKNKDQICSSICPDKIKIETVKEIETEYIKLPPVIDTFKIEVPIQFYDTIIFEDKTWRVKFYLTESKLSADIQHLSDSIDKIIHTTKESISIIEEKTIIEKVKNPVNRVLIWIILILGIFSLYWNRKFLLITLRRIIFKI